MKKTEYLTFIYKNIKVIALHLMEIFNMNQDEAMRVIKGNMDIINNDDFYSALLQQDLLDTTYDYDKLTKFKEKLCNTFFMDNNQIKGIVCNLPQILLFSSKFDELYFIMKNKELKGFLFNDKNKYKSYGYLNNDNCVNIYNNELIIDKMLKSIYRNDINSQFHNNKKVKNIEYISLDDKLNYFSNYSKKNYYFQKIK